MDADQYESTRKQIEECPPADLPGVIDTLEQLMNEARENGDLGRADNFKELLRVALRR